MSFKVSYDEYERPKESTPFKDLTPGIWQPADPNYEADRILVVYAEKGPIHIWISGDYIEEADKSWHKMDFWPCYHPITIAMERDENAS